MRFILAAIIAAVQLAASASAEEQYEFFRWVTPQLYGKKLYGRQRVEDWSPGYPPEFGSCGSGSTCSDACGSEFEACNATTSLSLFCYNPSRGQTCCPNGSGRACEEGYYCAWNEINGRTFCCANGQTELDCQVTPTTTTSPTSPPTSTVTSTVTGNVSTTTWTETLTGTTVTAWLTATVSMETTIESTIGATETITITGPGGSTQFVTVTSTITSPQNTITQSPVTVTVSGGLATTTIFSTVFEHGTCPASSSPVPPSTSTTPPTPPTTPCTSSTRGPPQSVTATTTPQPPPGSYQTTVTTSETVVVTAPCYELIINGVTHTVTSGVPLSLSTLPTAADAVATAGAPALDGNLRAYSAAAVALMVAVLF